MNPTEIEIASDLKPADPIPKGWSYLPCGRFMPDAEAALHTDCTACEDAPIKAQALEWWGSLSAKRKNHMFQKVAERLLLEALRPMVAEVLPSTVKDEVHAYVRQVLLDGWRDNDVAWGQKLHIEAYLAKSIKAEIGSALQGIQTNISVSVQKAPIG